MPNPFAHIDIAMYGAAALVCPPICDDLGSYLLGSCSPDIRIITGNSRDETHFAPLTNQEIGAGAKRMFRTYPNLTDIANLPGKTQAFIAGYVSHLIADEVWIIKVYRPYFDNRKLFQNQMVANVMDRALQLEMDREAMDRHNGMKWVVPHIEDAHVGIQVDFLPVETLMKFEQWLGNTIHRGFTWDRLRFMATRRQAFQDTEKIEKTVEGFMESPPDGLKHIYEYLPMDILRSYRDTVIKEWSKIIRGYLL
ncbi:hypothetical protein M1N24_00780 [Dehalococcoidia bacterium]|nr:hypothetical protein [Dehalococcoidia bacterium]